MPEPSQLLLFLVASWTLNLTPGADVAYIVSNSVRSGARAGAVAVLGITCGCLVHVVAAATGAGALLAASPHLFLPLLWCGAAYLVVLGVKTLMSTSFSDAMELHAGEARREMGRVFAGGFLSNALNPKVALFFLAFLPQFVQPQAADKTLAFLALGLAFNAASVPVNLGWAALAARVVRIPSMRRAAEWINFAAGLMLIGFGVTLFGRG